MNRKSCEELFAVVAPGLEAACVAELARLDVAAIRPLVGGVAFSGRLVDLYRANLSLRTASRVIVRFARCRCRDFPELYRVVSRLPWGRFLRPGTPVNCRVTCRTSRLMHGGRIADTLREAIAHALRGQPPADEQPPQLLLARLVDDQLELSIDSSGELLHRRGYRSHVAAAPLRETLAAGVLQLLGWTGDEPLADPLCGTGTLLLEGALLAARKAPGANREFAFMHWPGYRPGLWQQLCEEARRAEQSPAVAISGGDADTAALAAARANLARAGLNEVVTLWHRSLAAVPVHAGRGLVVCNPPYGKRLVTAEPLENWFAGLGRELQRAYPQWRKALLAPEPRLAKATGLPLRKVAELDNGGLRVGLYVTEAETGGRGPRSRQNKRVAGNQLPAANRSCSVLAKTPCTSA